MPATSGGFTGVKVIGLNQFRADMRRALGAYPRQLGVALKAAGEPMRAKASEYAPVLSGDLAGGYKVQVAGTVGRIVSSVPYAAGAEWGTHGKWSGFLRYGSRGGRFAYRAVQEGEATLTLALEQHLHDVITAYGWYH